MICHGWTTGWLVGFALVTSISTRFPLKRHGKFFFVFAGKRFLTLPFGVRSRSLSHISHSSSFAITCTCTSDYIAILTWSQIPIDVKPIYIVYTMYDLFSSLHFVRVLFLFAVALHFIVYVCVCYGCVISVSFHLPLIWNSSFLWNAQLFQFFLIFFVIHSNVTLCLVNSPSIVMFWLIFFLFHFGVLFLFFSLIFTPMSIISHF